MTEAPALACLRKAKLFLELLGGELKLDPDKTTIGVRAVLPSGRGRTVSEMNLGAVLREAATLIAEAETAEAALTPSPAERRPS